MFNGKSHWSNELAFTTTLIKGQTADGESLGTGFFFSYEDSGPLLVTNNHVMEDVITGEFLMHMHAADDDYNSSGVTVKISPPNFQNWWTKHPNHEIDLCAARLRPMLEACGISEDDLYSCHFSESHIALDTELLHLPLVENVVMVGYPNGLWDEFNGLPIIRRGITASHPSVNFGGKPDGIVDIAVFPGSSGSPVVSYNDGIILDSNHPATKVRSRTLLLGVLYSQFVITTEGKIEYRSVPTKRAPYFSTSAGLHIGLYCKSRELIPLAKALPPK
jgi:hypothetical protein